MSLVDMNECNVCGSENVSHEEKVGRGRPPKGWKQQRGDNRRISWKGMWDIWICNECGNKVTELRNE